MRSRRSLIFRLTLCLVLGAITTWLVAWALATAVWAGWLQPKFQGRSSEFAVKEPYLITRSRSVNRIQTSEDWRLTRLDRDDPMSMSAQRKVTRLLAKTDEPSTESSETPVNLLKMARVPSPTRRNSLSTEFRRSGLPRLLDDTTWMMIHHTTDGWPWRCLSRAKTIDGVGSYPSVYWTLHIVELDRFSPKYRRPETLALPLHPIWPGLLLNAGFYGAIWAMPLVCLPLLRTRRRRRKGRCPRCGYDLKHALEPGCPECGWRRSTDP
jgi:hypothetical protein